MKRTILSLLVTAAMLLSLLAPLRASAAETAGPGLTLTVSGSKLTATYTGTESNPTLVSAGYDRSGQMQSVETKNGKKAEFTRKNGLTYRVFALAPNTSAPLCEAGIEAETEGVLFSGRAEVPCADRTVAEATAAAVRQALNARMALEEVLKLDPRDVYQNKDELARQQKIVQDAMDAYDGLMDAGAVLWAVANAQAEKDAEKAAALQDAGQEEALHWAQKLTEQYDSIQSNKKLGALGEMLGCDARTAYQQLTVAQEILRGNYESQAKTYDNWVKGLTVVKTTAKVSMLVCGTIATGGAAGMLTAGEAVGVAVGTVDAGIEIAKTGATVIWGDDGKITKKFEDTTKPITTVTSIYSLLTFDPNSAAPGEVLMFFNDMGEGMRDNYGTVMDELKDFRKDGDTLTVEVTSTRVSEEEMKEKIDKPLEKSGEPKAEDLDQIKEQMDENREPLTEETLDAALEELLKEEGLLEENQTLEDFDKTETKKDFEKKIIEDREDGNFLDDNTDDDDGDDGETFIPTGLYETYRDDILVGQNYYDENGVLLWRANYDYETGGRLKELITYSNGEKPGSFKQVTQYYYKDEDLSQATEENPVYSTELYQWQVGVPGEHDGWTACYGDWFKYYPNGVMLEHQAGNEELYGELKTLYLVEHYHDLSGQASLWYDNVHLPDGTLVHTQYYSSIESRSQYFDTRKHPAERHTSYPESTSSMTIERWDADTWNYHEIAWDEEGNATAVAFDVGYVHQTDYYTPDGGSPTESVTEYETIDTIEEYF